MQNGWTDNITFSTNGMYTSRYWVDNITIQNIDIDQPIFMCVWGNLSNNIKVQNNINVEVLYNNGADGAFVFKCTSTEAATLEICDMGLGGG